MTPIYLSSTALTSAAGIVFIGTFPDDAYKMRLVEIIRTFPEKVLQQPMKKITFYEPYTIPEVFLTEPAKEATDMVEVLCDTEDGEKTYILTLYVPENPKKSIRYELIWERGIRKLCSANITTPVLATKELL